MSCSTFINEAPSCKRGTEKLDKSMNQAHKETTCDQGIRQWEASSCWSGQSIAICSLPELEGKTLWLWTQDLEKLNSK